MPDSNGKRTLPTSQSVTEMFEWLRRRISSTQSNGETLRKKYATQVPECIESTVTEQSRDSREMADLFPLSRINVKDPLMSLGLMEDEASSRIHIDGPNIIAPTSSGSKARLYLSQYLQSFRLLLLITAIICFIIFLIDRTHHFIDLTIFVLIILVLIAMSSFNYYQELWTRKFNRGFQSMIAPSCTVIRGGRTRNTTAESLVPGDIVLLQPGQRVPADVRLLHTDSLRIDTSWITGDVNPLVFVATPVPRDIPAMQAQNIAFNGCLVASGSGMGVVIKTGNSTVLGRLVSLTSDKTPRPSRLVKDKVDFVRFICILSIVVGTATFLIGISVSHLTNVLTILINGFFIAMVANIPQGLPVMLSAQLLIVARRLAKRTIFLKRAYTAETLGTTSALLVDKTGILTKNEITVTDLWYDGLAKSRRSHAPKGDRMPVETFDYPLDRILESMIICNRAELVPITRNSPERWRKASNASFMVFSKHAALSPSESHISLPEILPPAMAAFNNISGTPIDAALMRFADEICIASELRADYEVVFEIPFNKQRRWHLVICRRWTDANEPPDAMIRYHLLVKGAPEELITRCLQIATRTGDKPIGERELEQFKDQYLSFGNRGRSCIGFASVDFEDLAGKEFDMNNADYPEDGLTFLGIAALLDAPRPELVQTIQKAHDAKIKLHVVTGDHPSTAAAVAKEVGLIDESSPEAMVVIGTMLDLLTPKEWDVLLKRDHIVFARISPDQKKQVVEELVKRGEVVAVTGDGVLDAPALKAADVGIAVDATGSAIAKEAASILVVEGSLANLLYGIEQGRVLFENLKKSIAYTLTHLLAEILPILLTFVLGMPLGLTSVQVFAIDLLCEIFPSTAMIFETPERDIMKKRPRQSSSHLVSRSMLLYSYVFAGVLIAVGCLLSYLSVYWKHGIAPSELLFSAVDFWHDRSPAFNATSGVVIYPAMQDLIRRQACGAWQVTLVGAQALHVWQCRTRRVSLLRHTPPTPWLVFGVFMSITITAVLVYVPGINRVVGAAPPPGFVFLFPAVVGLVLFVFNEIRKFFIRRSPKNPVVRVFKW